MKDHPKCEAEVDVKSEDFNVIYNLAAKTYDFDTLVDKLDLVPVIQMYQLKGYKLSSVIAVADCVRVYLDKVGGTKVFIDLYEDYNETDFSVDTVNRTLDEIGSA